MPENDTKNQIIWLIAKKAEIPDAIIPLWQRWAKRRSEAQLWSFVLGMQKPVYKTRFEMSSKSKKLRG